MADAAVQRGRGFSRGTTRGGSDRGGQNFTTARGRGRGRGNAGGTYSRGRGAGTSATGPSHAPRWGAPPSTNATGASSPFAQLNQQNRPNQPSPFSNASGSNQSRTASPAADNAYNPISAQRTQRHAPNGRAHGHGGFTKQQKFESAATSGSFPDRYEQLKIDRTKERQKAIRNGLMADPNQPTSLNKAIRPVGTCESMCPEFERVERIVQKMVDRSEKQFDPSTNSLQNVEAKMLKRFRRSAAGYDEQLPSDIRTPKALLQATNYLIRYIVGGTEPLGVVHKFVWDRTRSIRNDFSVQQVTRGADVKIAVLCLERIARFHILSLHLLSSPANEEQFDRHQEREQLNNTMLSLMYYYDDNRGRVHFPNEEEFRAYYIIFSIHDQRPDLESRVQKWPAALLNSPRVQVALELYAAACNTWEYQGTLDARRPNAIAQGFYSRFFHIIDSRSVSYLMACVAEIYFTHVRQTTIRAIWKAYCRVPLSQQHKNDEWTLEQLTKLLHFDDEEQTIRFCENQDLQFAENSNGEKYLNWGSRPVESVGFSPSSEHAFSETYVESKRAGRNLVAVILGMSVREAASIGMIDKSVVSERMRISPAGSPAPARENVFTSSKDNAPAVAPTQAFPTSFGGSFMPSTLPAQEAVKIAQPFQPPSLPSSGAPAQATPAAGTSVPATGLNPFSTMFSNKNASDELNKASTIPAPAQESSAASPFSFGKPSEITQGATEAPSTDSSNQENGAATELAPASNPFFSVQSGPGTASVIQTAATNSFSSTKTSSLSPFSFPKPTVTAPATSASSPIDLSKPTHVTSAEQEKVPPVPSLSTSNQQLQPATTFPASSPFAFPSSNIPTNIDGAAVASPNPFAASLSAFGSSKPPPVAEDANINPILTKPSALLAKSKDSDLLETAQTTSTSVFPSGPLPSSNGLMFPPPTTPADSTYKDNHATANVPSFNQKGPSQGLSTGLAFTQTPSFNQVPQTSPFQSLALPDAGKGSDGLFKPSLPSSQPQQQKDSAPKKVPTLFGPSAEASTFVSSQMQKPLFPPGTTATTSVPSRQRGELKYSPSLETTLGKATESSAQVAAPQERALTVSQLDHSVATLVPTAPSNLSGDEQWRPPQNKEEEVALFKRIMKRAEEKAQRKEDKRKRKRLEEEQALAESLREERRKLSKSASPDEEPSGTKKFSLVQSYVKSLPTLPCLDKTRKLLESKAPAQAESEVSKKRQREIDEDELLLNSARIVAEQLRSGPKIFDDVSPQSLVNYNAYHDYWEQRSKSRLSHSNSASPSATPFAQSASPPQFPRHPYSVAYAPDTSTGLGRTMSRTEYRIRMTGGHGLAYKPLDFSRARASSGQKHPSQEKENGTNRFAMSG
ncbi:Uncharacterized protein PECH_008651 [Penicillium ucsense]|uniref:SAC3/GANP/THP3 conserved domain-containing protein n=1 Tax=Penicillium ucsense TaxID=2839758 RepID=A0A8J8WKK8_9EURO|nr:Uncharacterized protein PECM_005226 [Penicillium ucsense]KAF7738656.1 Uncharacterized protein PECH_008651 [Penicillium ucsense]